MEMYVGWDSTGGVGWTLCLAVSRSSLCRRPVAMGTVQTTAMGTVAMGTVQTTALLHCSSTESIGVTQPFGVSVMSNVLLLMVSSYMYVIIVRDGTRVKLVLMVIK